MISPNVFDSEPVGRLAVIPGEEGDLTDIVVNGPGRVVADFQIVDHPLAQVSHMWLLLELG